MIIAGAGSLGIQILDQLLLKGYSEEKIAFFDENLEVLQNDIIKHFRSFSDYEDVKNALKKDRNVFIAVGHSRRRKKLSLFFQNLGATLNTIIDDHATISRFSKTGIGSCIQPGCRIAHNVTIGTSFIAHANTIISHDVIIGDYNSYAQNVNVMKNVKIGDCCFIGANTVIMPDVNIGNNVIIGANCIVDSDMQDNSSISYKE